MAIVSVMILSMHVLCHILRLNLTLNLKETELDSFKDEVKQTLDGFKPVEVHVTKASSFKPTNNVIYFKVENRRIRKFI